MKVQVRKPVANFSDPTTKVERVGLGVGGDTKVLEEKMEEKEEKSRKFVRCL